MNPFKLLTHARATRLAVMAVVAVVAVVATGCAKTVVGSGRIASPTPGQTASFSFVFHVVNPDGSGILDGTYEDGPVRLRFDGLLLSADNPGLFDNCGAGTGRYISTNRERRGSGQLLITPCEGDGNPLSFTSRDSFSIAILTGPLAGYSNSGNLRNGSITAGSGGGGGGGKGGGGSK